MESLLMHKVMRVAVTIVLVFIKVVDGYTGGVNLQEGPLSDTLYQGCMLFGLERPPAFRKSLKMWCVSQCSDRLHCYHVTPVPKESACLFCVPYPVLIPADSLLQASNRTLNPTDTVIYKLDGYNQKVSMYQKDGSLTQAGARSACLNQGEELLSISSVQEWQVEIPALMVMNPNNGYWIDLKKSNGVWGYGDGSEDIPELWAPSRPDGTGDCGWVYGSNRLLYDGPCQDIFYFICEVHSYIIV